MNRSKIFVERFGEKYLTVFNDSGEEADLLLTLNRIAPSKSVDLVTGAEITWEKGDFDYTAKLKLRNEDVAVISLSQ